MSAKLRLPKTSLQVSNIGITLEALTRRIMVSPVTVSYIRGLKAAGFNAVRIHCAWNKPHSGKTTAEKAQKYN
ncbi:hypothetical protein [Duncaniella muris]|uniref:hypothetical protein n=1 Tax=Duncaniella muris TaxID=2094150 RepID=UPI003F665BC1